MKIKNNFGNFLAMLGAVRKVPCVVLASVYRTPIP